MVDSMTVSGPIWRLPFFCQMRKSGTLLSRLVAILCVVTGIFTNARHTESGRHWNRQTCVAGRAGRQLSVAHWLGTRFSMESIQSSVFRRQTSRSITSAVVETSRRSRDVCLWDPSKTHNNLQEIKTLLSHFRQIQTTANRKLLQIIIGL